MARALRCRFLTCFLTLLFALLILQLQYYAYDIIRVSYSDNKNLVVFRIETLKSSTIYKRVVPAHNIPTTTTTATTTGTGGVITGTGGLV